MTEYKARIGEVIVGNEEDILVATALGSCMGMVIYDLNIKAAVLAHIALPELLPTPKGNQNKNLEMPGRYATTAITECCRLLEKMGAKKRYLRSKIAGGSRMFEMPGKDYSGIHIGVRNIVSVVNILEIKNIPLISKDVGGNSSRTIKFTVKNFNMNIKKGLENIVI